MAPALPDASRRTRRAFLRDGLTGCLALGVLPPLGIGRRLSVRFVAEFGGKGKKEGQLQWPIAIACNGVNELFVTEVYNSRVSVFGADGQFLGAFDLPHDGEHSCGSTAAAGGIAVDDEGHVYVSFRAGNKVVVFDAQGQQVREWGGRGRKPGKFIDPGGLLLDAEGRLLVADQGNRRVQTFTREGELLSAWGKYGSKPGQFDGIEAVKSQFGGPHYLAMNDRGELYTTEGAAGRVQRWSSDGQHLAAWGNKDDEPGGFGALDSAVSKNTLGPIGICTDHEGRVWVSSLNSRVQLFTPEGEYLTGIGGAGAGPGQFNLPHAMAVDGDGYLYVVDSGNHRVQKFEVV